VQRFLVFTLLLGACSSAAAVQPAPTPEPAGPTSSVVQGAPPSARPETVPAVLPEGFELVAAQITKSDGTVCDLCLWLADNGDRRRRGLMSVTDLGPADGMAFAYGQPGSSNFWMKDTLLPLSIAFYDVDGQYLDAFDMEPCVVNDCSSFPTPGEFLVAIEAHQGTLGELGLEPGSKLELIAGTTQCPEPLQQGPGT
jgi:uncharacterized protein